MLTTQQQFLIDPTQSAWTDMNFACTREEMVQDPSCRKTRNAGGAQYYHYIMENMYDEQMPYQDFMNLHKVYCAVSGSPIIDTNRATTVQMEGPGETSICGEYHRCCTPCLCDLQRFAKVHPISLTFLEGTFDVHALTIPDPCKNELPPDITSFQCSPGCFEDNGARVTGGDASCFTSNAVRLPGDRIVIGVLQNGRSCTADDVQSVQESRNQHCLERMTASSGELRTMGGMSNIFTELACNNDGCPTDAYY